VLDESVVALVVRAHRFATSAIDESIVEARDIAQSNSLPKLTLIESQSYLDEEASTSTARSLAIFRPLIIGSWAMSRFNV